MGAGVDRCERSAHAGRGVLQLQPPLDALEREMLLGLAGRGPVLRVWPGQPRSRSPWLPCETGCCLELSRSPRADPAAWMRFLMRVLLAPRSRPALARAGTLGLPGGHRVTGRAGMDQVEVVVRGGRVQLLPVGGQRRSGVVDDGDGW